MQSAPADHIQPRLALNTPSGCRVLNQICTELRNCERFQFYVAFANQAGAQKSDQPADK